MSNTCEDKNKVSEDMAKVLNNIPVLRYQKDPVLHLEDLYIKYPQGGEFGWFAFVASDNTFAYWDIKEKDWKLLSHGDLQTILGLDVSILKDGDVPVWDNEKEKFSIVHLSVWGIEEY